MDVRHFDFLVRQPSARLLERHTFWGLPKRGIALILINALFWQPIWAQAEGIAVSGGTQTTLNQAGNGVPIVNIAAPNATGLSHNQYQQYNVGSEGAILNNATARTQNTQLGGIIVGNPNFQGTAATTILNEVVGANASQLKGYTEVAGQAARVIVANPYGVTCNGCGFINTPRATLTTGTPVLDNGRLDHFQVNGGQITVEGQGLDASSVDQFEIITRAAQINGQINARQLTVVAGRNAVDAQTLAPTALADDGSAKPTVAIDSSALGGMYAGAIKLVGTEAGVGVKLAGNLAASAGDIQIDANGQLTVAQASAAAAVNVNAAALEATGPVYAGTAVTATITGDLANRGNLAARDTVRLSSGGQLTNSGIVEAGVNADNSRNTNGDVTLTAQNLRNTGSVTASRGLTATVRQTLNNQGGALNSQARTQVTATTLDNRQAGRVLSQGSLDLATTDLLNGQGGLVSSTGNLALLTTGVLNNDQGDVSAAGNATVTAASLSNRGGQVTADQRLNLTVTGALDNQGGTLGAGQGLTLNAGSLDNRQAGVVVTDGELNATVGGTLDNCDSGSVQAKGPLTLTSQALDNRGGVLRATQAMHLAVGQLDNSAQGVITGSAGIDLTGQQLNNQSGLLNATGPLQVQVGTVLNGAGRIASQADLTATVDTLTQQGGELVAQGALHLTGNQLDNRAGGLVGATKALTLDVAQVDNRGGELSSQVGVALNGQQLDNSDGGKVLAGTALALAVERVINQNKGLLFGDTLSLTGHSLNNTQGTLAGQHGTTLALRDALNNSAGTVSSEALLTVNAGTVQNAGGSFSSAAALMLTATGEVSNQGGAITTDAALALHSASLDNRNGGLLSGKGATAVTTGAFDNSQGRLTSTDTLALTATQVTNQAGGRIASAQALTASVTGLDQQGGQLFSNTALTLNLNNGLLNNSNGLINAPALALNNLGVVINQSGELSSDQAFTLAAQQLDNSDGLLSSRDSLALNVTQGVLNQNGAVIADSDLQVTAATLDNSQGQVSAKRNLTAHIGRLQQQGGQFIAQGALDLTGDSLVNNADGLIAATQGLTLAVADLDNRGGELSSQGDITLTGQRLDNSDGGKVLAQRALALNLAQVTNRNRGVLSGHTGLILAGTGLDNQGGTLASLGAIDLAVADLLNNSQGVITSEGTLSARVGSLTNTGGSLSSAGVLTLSATGAVLNQGGEIVTDDALTLTSATLDNRNTGSLSSKGALALTTGALNNTVGRISTATQLALTAGQVTNRDGGSIGSGQALVASVTGLDQQGGQLFSNTTLTLNLNNGLLNNQNGLINAPGALLLQQLGEVQNQGGEISSSEGFTLAVQQLNNNGGKVLSNQALSLRIAQALTNVKGMIAAASLDATAASLDNSNGTLTSRGDLQLTADGLLSNRDNGLINAAQALTLFAGSLDNQAGQLLGTRTLTLTTGTLNTTAKGLINSQGTLNLTAASLDTSSGGEVSSAGDMVLALNGLTQTGGRLLSDAGLSLDLHGADLNNRTGLINAKGPLLLQRVANVNNQGGEISSAQGFTLGNDTPIGTLDNTNGKLISNAQLGLTANSLINQNGLISGWQGLSLTGDSLDNRNNGTLSARAGNLTATLSGAVLNSNGGALVSQQALTVSAASLDNRGGILSSGTAQSLALNGVLDNSQNGLIDSGADLALTAASLNNAAGQVNAAQSARFTGTTLDNSAGTFSSQGAIALDLLGALINTNGKLASGGALQLLRSSQVANQGGQLVSQRLMTLNTGSLDNRNRGTIAANERLALTASGDVLNSNDGLIYSQGADVQLQAASLTNTSGAVQSQGALGVNVGGDLGNLDGRLIAQNGDLTVTAANLDSRGGVLSSLQGAFTARITGVLKNGYDLNRQGGVIQAQRLDLLAANGLNNYGGRVSAQGGDALVNASSFDNRNGGLYAKGLVRFTGNTFDNSGDNDGQIAGNQVDLNLTGALNNRFGVIESDTTLNVTAASLDNQTGKIRALGSAGATRFNIGGTFDNRNGTLETANNDLAFNVGNFLNTNGSLLHVGTGEFGISTANITNAGGSIVTRGGLTLNADSWTNSSVIQAGRLTVNVGQFVQTASGQLLASDAFVGTGGNWTNDGLIASDGSLSLNLSGAYGGNGRVSSVGNLTVQANSLSLGGPDVTLAAGGAGWVQVADSLVNRGRLTANGGLTLTAGTLNNYGTLGGANSVGLIANTVLNDGGLLFSGGRFTVNATDFTNHYGDLYSLGDLNIEGRDANSRASTFSNRSGSVESNGNLTLNAATVLNTRDVFEMTAGLVSGDLTMYCLQHCSGGDSFKRGPITLTRTVEGEVVQDSPMARLISGNDLTVTGDTITNQYSLVSATRDLTFTAAQIVNQGAASVSGTSTVDVASSVKIPTSTWNARERDVNVYHTKYGSGTFDAAAFKTLLDKFDPKLFTHIDDPLTVSGDGESAAPAILQAGGRATLNASNDISNIVVSHTATQPAASVAEYSVAPTAINTTITLNAQLPPNLAQQQINPLSLPGFSLPTGQNGLFRLSGQGSSTPQFTQATGTPQSWTLTGASISTAQREQGAPATQARGVQFGSAALLATSAGQLAAVTRQGAGIEGTATAITTQGDTGTGGGTYVVPSYQAGTGGMTQAGGVAPVNAGTQAAASAQTVNKVQGLPSSAAQPNYNKYLIETNPVLTDLKQFMSSDYLLAGLGYDPDQSAKRLGDGLYEQRLVQQAVTARTGQAFIDGQTSNEAQFKYLMNNALASKTELNLSVGVSLTAEQVAALTHDIVWMENAVVNGETVLVPVVYLAQASGRLGPTGALIAGNDVTLIAGQNLDNVGTLKAANNLSATAGNDLVNSGLIQAGNRLDLLAGNTIVNKAGGIIAGRDVSVTAVNGDVLNERTVTAVDSAAYGQRHTDYTDNAARIEAANDLSVQAGRDINNLGSTLQSGRDLSLSAGRDVNIAATQVTNSLVLDRKHTSSDITQLGATVTAGRDLSAQAGRDLNVIASSLDAKRDVALSATEDLSISSAADEQHSYSKSKKVTRQEDHVSQVASTVKAGGSVAASAGQDLAVIGSQIKATEDVALDAKRDMLIGAAQNEDFSYYSKKKKGSFGRSSTKETQSYASTNEGSVIEAGGDLTVNTQQGADGGVTLNGGRNVAVVGSQLKAGNDLLMGATGDVVVASGENESGASSKKTKSGTFGLSKKGSSQLQTQVTQVGSDLEAGNDAVVIAGRDVQLSASTLNAGHDAQLQAGLTDATGDVRLNADSNEAYLYAESWKKKAGLFLAGGSNLTGGGSSGFGVSVAQAEKKGHVSQQTTSIGSEVNAGNDATLKAARDVALTGSSVDAGGVVALNAGRDITLAAGTSSTQQGNWSSKAATGMSLGADRNGFTAFAGKEAAKGKTTQGHEGVSPSTLNGLDVTLSASRDILQAGSDVTALRNVAYSAGRDIAITAGTERDTQTSDSSFSRSGATVTANHNYGNTVDALKNAGQGEDGVSKASSTLAAIDAVDQFARGPTLQASIGNSKSSASSTATSTSARGSTVSAGQDFTAVAGNNLLINGGNIGAGRDINLAGRDIDLGIARGESSSTGEQKQSSAGLNAGTANGVKVGIGASQGVANQTGLQQTALGSTLDAGRDINAQAQHDLTLTGTQASAGRDVQLHAGNDLTIQAAQNASSSQDTRHSGGGEVGLTAGRSGIGPYASINMGRGTLNRDGTSAQMASVTAGNALNVSSGRDTTVAGATLRGDSVSADVGRNLTVSSVPDTGTASGKQTDESATATIGPMPGLSGSVGYGRTNGNKNWVNEQTSITAANQVAINTGEHTQLNGALINSDTGKLKLDTQTLGFADLAGLDKEHSYYLNVGGSVGLGGATGGAQDPSQTGKGKPGVAGWSVQGYNAVTNREQQVRATVGAGDLVVRNDATTGNDSTAGLNRDPSKAYEITRDEQHRTDVYASGSSIGAASHPIATASSWAQSLVNYDKVTKQNFDQAALIVGNQIDAVQHPGAGQSAIAVGGEALADQALAALVQAGIGRADARGLLADKDFQASVLQELASMNAVQNADPRAVAELKKTLIDPVTGERNILVTSGIKRTAEQNVLYGASYINQYIQQNPEKAELVEIVLAAAQGPKGLMLLAAQKALGATEDGKKLAEYSSAMAQSLGKTIAESLDNKTLDAQKVNDQFVIGGGTLMAVLLVGLAVPKIAKSRDNAAHNAASYAGLKLDLKTTEAANNVVDSLRTTGQLPSNYVTKAQAAQQGWQPGKALNNSVPSGQMGGDVFANSSNVLPSSTGRTWFEADVGLTNTMSRSNQPGTRLLYSSDGLLYITTDHYKTVTSIGNWK